MSLLGKILAGLNVLAAAAFVYLALGDWSQRQAWTYAVYRLGLTLDGLPVDADDTDLEGASRAERLSPATVGALFPSGDAPPEITQAGEVRRVHAALRQQIEGIADEAERRKRLSAVLVPLASTLDARQALQDQIDKQPTATVLDGPFEAAFNAALQNKGPRGEDSGLEHQRRAIAHLLFGVSQDDAARQRTAIVVGLRAYAAAANEQAAAFQRMADRLRVVLTQTQGDFIHEYQAALGRVTLLTDDLKAREAVLAKHQALTEQHTTILNARVSDVQTLRQQLEAATTETRKALEALTQEQALLFAAQERVGQGVETNRRLEREIRTLEQTKP